MPQLTAVVLKDAANVAQTYGPRDVTSGVATLAFSTGVPVGERKLTISGNQTTTGRRKITMKMAIPITQDVAVGGVSKPTVVRTSYFESTITFDPTSTTDERTNVLAILRSLFADTTLVQPTVVALESVY